MTAAVKLHLDRIRVDGGTQSRAALNAEAVADYAQVLEALPPVVVFFDGTDYWLADGFHRVAAARQVGAKKLAADVRQGTQRDAKLHSAGANANNGVRRTNADKRRAVEALLRDEEWSRWSDREVAKRAAVSQPFVGAVRAELAAGDNGYHLSAPATRTGADGKSYPATRGEVTTTPEAIGAALAQVEAEEATDDGDPFDLPLPEGPPDRGPESYDGDEWYTPAKYVELARQVMGGIDLDPASCAHAQQTVQATTYYSKEVDGRFGKWIGRVWLNPPYSDPSPWTSKLLEEYEAGRVREAVLLVNNATDAGWFQELLQTGTPVCFVAGRMRFERPDRESGPARQGQAFVYLGRNEARFVAVFGELGTVVTRSAMALAPAQARFRGQGCGS